MERVPATVLTGFLGAGKSTLLRRVLTEEHERRIAVIVNEFGEVDVDTEIIRSDPDEQIVQLTNGCVCCGIRDDLRDTLSDLARQRAGGAVAFDQVVIETTGLADPGPVAQTFFLDDDVSAHYRPDAVITLVDAVHGMQQLDARREARRQVGFADRLFVSKVDIAPPADVAELSARLRRMNPGAPQRQTAFGDVPLSELFDVGGFELDGDVALDDGHDGHHHHDDEDVSSITFRAERPLHGARFAQFMDAVVRSYATRLLRYKGILDIAGYDRRVVLQGVHQLMSHEPGAPWRAGEERATRLVLIGIELPRELLLAGLERCLV